jgi:hypothetical protein
VPERRPPGRRTVRVAVERDHRSAGNLRVMSGQPRVRERTTHRLPAGRWRALYDARSARNSSVRLQSTARRPEYRWKWFGNVQASPDGVFDLGGEYANLFFALRIQTPTA